MDERSARSAAPPRRAPARRRRTARPARTPAHRPDTAHRAETPARRTESQREITAEDPTPIKAGGSGSSGRGPIDDDDPWRRRDRGDDDSARRPLLMALALLAIGAGVMSVRLLARSARRN